MTNYIPLKSIIAYIPKPLFNYSNEVDFLSWSLLGLRETKLVTMFQPVIKIFKINNGVVNLPSDVKEINLVTYLQQEPCKEDIVSLQDCITTESTEPEPEIGNYSIAYKLFLESPYYNNNYKILQYKGNGAYLCKNCPNKKANCQETYTVDYNKTLHTSLKEGYLCIDYDTEIKDLNGDILIPDYPELRQFLVFYCIAKHWEERSMMSEQNANRMADDYLVKAEIYLNKLKGSAKLRAIDANSITLLQGGQYQKLIKIPGAYVYSR